jgi:hypothetical protein
MAVGRPVGPEDAKCIPALDSPKKVGGSSFAADDGQKGTGVKTNPVG